MRLAIVAHRSSQTNDALLAAGDALGIHTVQLTPREALHSLRPADVAVARLDVRETCDGIEDGMRELEKLAAAGALVLNPPAALAATHDKLLTSRALRRAGLPHPHTWLIADGIPSAVPELPIVIKRRYGDGATTCRTHGEVAALTRRLCGEDGVLAQELVCPRGAPVRLVVAGGRVIGGDAAWTPPMRTLAILAADAVHADLVGVDLLPTNNGWLIVELQGAVDLPDRDAERALIELLRVARDRRAAAA
jgi:glutathione synthase/RimK-type ligase-like ATP-grasp enzyme